MKLKLLVCALLLGAGSAFAMDPSKEGPCKTDIETHCKDVKPGAGAIMKCLHQNSEKLSEACKSRGRMAQAKMKEIRGACKEDFKKHCAGVKPGGAARMKCFAENKEKFSAECRSEMESMADRRERGRRHR